MWICAYCRENVIWLRVPVWMFTSHVFPYYLCLYRGNKSAARCRKIAYIREIAACWIPYNYFISGLMCMSVTLGNSHRLAIKVSHTNFELGKTGVWCRWPYCWNKLQNKVFVLQSVLVCDGYFVWLNCPVVICNLFSCSLSLVKEIFISMWPPQSINKA